MESTTVTPAQPAAQLIITCDWQGTLNEERWHNIDLLVFLSDAKKAGHRVIITSGSSVRMDLIPEMLEMIINTEHSKYPDLISADQFELMSKKDLKESKLDIDYAFDNKPIADQWIPDYAGKTEEIRVHKDFSTSPVSLGKLRKICGIPSRDQMPFSAVPVPFAPPAPL